MSMTELSNLVKRDASLWSMKWNEITDTWNTLPVLDDTMELILTGKIYTPLSIVSVSYDEINPIPSTSYTTIPTTQTTMVAI